MKQTTTHGTEKKTVMNRVTPLTVTTPTPAASKPTGLSLNLDNDLTLSGARMLDQAFNARSFDRLRIYFEHANSKDLKTREAGLSVLFGVAMRSANLLQHFKGKGHIKFDGPELPTTEDLIYSIKTDVKRFIAQANQVNSTLAKVMEAAPGLKLLDEEVTKPEPQDAAPMKIEIVGMPIRKTTTKIIRDQSGDIATSVQVESDA